MGRAPIAVFGFALGTGDWIGDDRQVIGGAIAEHPCEKPRAACGPTRFRGQMEIPRTSPSR